MDRKHSKIVQRQYSNHLSNDHIQLFACNTADVQREYAANQSQVIVVDNRKRTRKNNHDDDDDDDDDDQHSQSTARKRIRYDQSSNCCQSENEPPSINIEQHSLHLHQPKYHSQTMNTNGNDHLSTSTLFNQLHSTNTQHSYETNFTNSFSSLNNSSLCTTNIFYDSKQQPCMSTTVHRTGNISPAYSDTSTESTSTCSSDEQQFQLFHYQTTRSNRERENYEQLLDLAEKLADPNRFNQINIEQFISYRYRTSTLTDQTACVICMSVFKNGQRIRVLPCQHEYHTKCIARWFTMNSSCPICRRENFFSN